MKWVLRSFLLIIVLFGVAMGVGWKSSSTLHVERSLKLDAEPFDVFPYLNDLRTFDQWSPWKDYGVDGYVVAGPASGEGQELAWQANDLKIGTGSQTIIESFQDSFVRSELSFAGQPAIGTYVLEPLEVSGVSVLLTVETELGGFPYIQRLFTAPFRKKTEAQFDRALSDLKRIVEAQVALNEAIDDWELSESVVE